MTFSNINVSNPNDGLGDKLRDAFVIVNDNFDLVGDMVTPTQLAATLSNYATIVYVDNTDNTLQDNIDSLDGRLTNDETDIAALQTDLGNLGLLVDGKASLTQLNNAISALNETIAELNVTISNKIRTYKVYSALLTQSGTSAPTAIVLENTLGVDVSFTYFLAGNYFINAIGAFTGNKTYVDVGQSIYATSAYIIIPNFPNVDQVQIRVTKVTDNTSSDNKLTNFPIEIRVYN